MNGNARVDAFSEDALANERILNLAQKVYVSENPSLSAMSPGKRPAQVTLYLQDGRRLSETVFSSQGNFDKPYPLSLVIDKFRQLAGEVVGSNVADELIDLCLNLEEVDNIASLSALLRPN
ncbi:hypothetical protein [Desulfosporosinus sp. BICA1-9]|uniref:hypothetical protein n=1 Tax=Desulfosporosinus sp. BICA1-9 TaxID=1531958 RepID=UPI000ACD8CB0|nr:hypothetical protein [Desulfosporosinus sp. BICA1-9]